MQDFRQGYGRLHLLQDVLLVIESSLVDRPSSVTHGLRSRAEIRTVGRIFFFFLNAFNEWRTRFLFEIGLDFCETE